MKKIGLGILMGAVILALSGMAATASPWDKGAEKSLENANGKVVFLSGPEILKDLLTIRHEFPNGFTADVTPTQLSLLNLLGIETEEVQLYHIVAKPVCGDGELHPSEDCEPGVKECPDGYYCNENCKCVAEEEAPARECYPSDQTPWGIEKVYASSTISSTNGGAGVDVAVLDTGVYKNHLDLVNRVEQCVDFTHPKKSPWVGKCDDDNGHGTHVSGTILADAGSDGEGIYGVAPEADLFAYKVCGRGGACWADDIAAAIDYAGDNGAEIVSMSLGGDTQSDLIADAIDRNPGLLFVAAAGNDGPEEGSIDYPGANVKVIAAGAIDSTEAVPDWSSRGINPGEEPYVIEEKEVEFGTPGVNVESTWNDGCYHVADGTSMATPHVSGLAAKLWQGNASSTRTYLQDRAKLYDLYTEGDDPATGFGLPTVK